MTIYSVAIPAVHTGSHCLTLTDWRTAKLLQVVASTAILGIESPETYGLFLLLDGCGSLQNCHWLTLTDWLAAWLLNCWLTDWRILVAVASTVMVSSSPAGLTTIFYCLTAWKISDLLSVKISYVTTDGQSESLSWCQTPILGPKTNFLLLSDSCGFVDMGLTIWRGDWSIVYNCYWSSPAQSFSVSSPEGLMTIFTVSESKLHEHGGPRPSIYILQELGGSGIPPDTVFSFCRRLRLARLFGLVT
jgi:hypothetical protein